MNKNSSPTHRKLITKLFGFSEPTFYAWVKEKKDKRKILNLIEKYFSSDDLAEFLETGSIDKYEKMIEREELMEKYEKDVVLPKIEKIIKKESTFKYALKIITFLYSEYKKLQNANEALGIKTVSFDAFVSSSVLSTSIILDLGPSKNSSELFLLQAAIYQLGKEDLLLLVLKNKDKLSSFFENKKTVKNKIEQSDDMLFDNVPDDISNTLQGIKV